jgi:hypothetical protein
MSASGALGIAGFVLSVIANLWTFGLTLVRWPRVSVESRSYQYVTPGGRDPADPRPRKVVLTVINRGSEAVTIGNIGLRAEDNSGRRDFEYDYIHYPERLPEGTEDPFPVRCRRTRRAAVDLWPIPAR